MERMAETEGARVGGIVNARGGAGGSGRWRFPRRETRSYERNEQMYSAMPEVTSMVKPDLAGTSK